MVAIAVARTRMREVFMMMMLLDVNLVPVTAALQVEFFGREYCFFVRFG